MQANTRKFHQQTIGKVTYLGQDRAKFRKVLGWKRVPARLDFPRETRYDAATPVS